MKIVCLSDTHTYLHKVEVPDGDVFIHAGDLTFTGTYKSTRRELKRIHELPHKHKIVIAGNHDFYFDSRIPSGHVFRSWVIKRYESVRDLLSHYPSVTYLQDSSVTIDGIKFYGTPWNPRFYDWAFQPPQSPVEAFGFGNEEWLAQKYANIPDDVNVLVTHVPPYGILDDSWDGRIGSQALRTRIGKLEQLRLHVFGHIHEAYGRQDFESEDGQMLTFVNAATNTREYVPTNPPIVVEI